MVEQKDHLKPREPQQKKKGSHVKEDCPTRNVTGNYLKLAACHKISQYEIEAAGVATGLLGAPVTVCIHDRVRRTVDKQIVPPLRARPGRRTSPERTAKRPSASTS